MYYIFVQLARNTLKLSRKQIKTVSELEKNPGQGRKFMLCSFLIKSVTIYIRELLKIVGINEKKTRSWIVLTTVVNIKWVKV